MDHAFDDVKPWPGQASGEQLGDGRDARLDNQPPLEERVAMEFEDRLRADGLLQRIEDITASAGRVPPISDQAIAGKVGDLISQARAAMKEVESRRETHNRPLLNAQRTLKGRADALITPMDQAIRAVRARLDAFIAEEERKCRETQRLADEQARIAREAAEKAAREAEEAGRPAPPPPPPLIEPAQVEKPLFRGDMGASVGTRTIWKHEIEAPIAKLPKAILENAKVVDAINQVIAAQVRAGTREIKGVKIWSETASAVR